MNNILTWIRDLIYKKDETELISQINEMLGEPASADNNTTYEEGDTLTPDVSMYIPPNVIRARRKGLMTSQGKVPLLNHRNTDAERYRLEGLAEFKRRRFHEQPPARTGTTWSY